MTKHPTPSFLLRLSGGEISPEKVPVRALSDAATAVFHLAARCHDGECDKDTAAVRILKVKRGSAEYACLMDQELNKEDLQAAGSVAENPRSENLVFHMLEPFKTLSRVAKKLNCEIQILDAATRSALATIGATTYENIRSTSVSSDDATVHGYLVRVGGAVDNRCAVRLPNRPKLLYCKVQSKELGRLLGRHLYQYVTLYGRGLFFTRTWDLLTLAVSEATFQTKGASFEAFVESVRSAGGAAWDDVVDPGKELRSMR